MSNYRVSKTIINKCTWYNLYYKNQKIGLYRSRKSALAGMAKFKKLPRQLKSLWGLSIPVSQVFELIK